MKQFEFRIDYSQIFSTDEIWPNGDAPENPTVEDVRKLLLDSKELWKWDLEPTVKDVHVKDLTEQFKKLKAAQEAYRRREAGDY